VIFARAHVPPSAGALAAVGFSAAQVVSSVLVARCVRGRRTRFSVVST
jgi:hypothetical protein